MEVTRVVRVQSGCRECLDLVIKTLSMLDGVLLMKFFNNDLVITYNTDNVSFGEIAQSVLSLGLGLILRKVIMNVRVKGNANLDELEPALSRAVDGVVSVLLDRAASRLSIIMHPDTDINAVINNLASMGITVNGIVTDEVSQVMMART